MTKITLRNMKMTKNLMYGRNSFLRTFQDGDFPFAAPKEAFTADKVKYVPTAPAKTEEITAGRDSIPEIALMMRFAKKEITSKTIRSKAFFLNASQPKDITSLIPKAAFDINILLF
jgi:hypothetical protein